MSPAVLQDILIGQAKLMGNNTVKYSLPGRVDVGGTVTARDIMIATGSVPFVPPGIPIDGKTVSCPDKLLSPERTRSHTLCSINVSAASTTLEAQGMHCRHCAAWHVTSCVPHGHCSCLY